ncbi:MAG: DUF1850 domain-containing protein [Clostridia bacterium]|nr:DUF1850 domain-containing protein [Clostridia bacterium]
MCEESRQHNQTGKRGNFLVPLFLAVALLLCFVPFRTRIVLSDYRTGRTLCTYPIGDGETFAIRYTHSVNLSSVTDTLEWTGKALILRTSLFTSFGAGIPVPADGIGTAITNTEDGFLLTGIDITQPDNALLIMLQQVPDHHLLYRDRAISLLDMAGSGALLRLCVRPVSLMTILLHS